MPWLIAISNWVGKLLFGLLIDKAVKLIAENNARKEQNAIDLKNIDRLEIAVKNGDDEAIKLASEALLNGKD